MQKLLIQDLTAILFVIALILFGLSSSWQRLATLRWELAPGIGAPEV